MLKLLLELMFKLLQFLEAIEIPFKREGLLDLSVRSSTLKLTSLNSINSKNSNNSGTIAKL